MKGQAELAKEENTFISLLPLAGDAVGVALSGFYYPLKNALLKTGSSLGVSNRIVDAKGRIDVKEGYLLVIKSGE